MRPFWRRASPGRDPLYRHVQIHTRHGRQQRQWQCRKVEQGEWEEIMASRRSNSVAVNRIFMNVVLWFSVINKKHFVLLYLISFWLDANFARLLNQASISGGFLEKITARLSPRLLLKLLSDIYKRHSGLLYGLFFLDDARECFQHFSIYKASKTGLKDMADSKSKLVRFFDQHRLFMGYCCVGAEVLYLLLFFTAEEGSDSLMNVLPKVMGSPMLGILTMSVLPAWAIRQFINVVQLCSAVADVFVIGGYQKAHRHQSLSERSFIVEVETVDGGGLVGLLALSQGDLKI